MNAKNRKRSSPRSLSTLIVAGLLLSMFLAPAPASAQAPSQQLPFSPGTKWRVSQGYYTDAHGGIDSCYSAGIHDPSEGAALYALDFRPVGHSNLAVVAAAGGYPGACQHAVRDSRGPLAAARTRRPAAVRNVLGAGCRER